MADRQSIDQAGAGTLDGLEVALQHSLETADSDEARYHIRTALQKVEVLREVGR